MVKDLCFTLLVAFGPSWFLTNLYLASIMDLIWKYDIILELFQSFLSKGMNSMNLTSMGLSLMNSTKSHSSSSLKPFIATTFNFTDSKFNSRALSIDYKHRSANIPISQPQKQKIQHFQYLTFIVCAKPPCLLVINWFLASTRVSRLMLIWFSPAARSRSILRGSSEAFVVRAMVLIEGRDFISDTISMMSFLTKG